MGFLIRVLLTALAFVHVFPHITGLSVQTALTGDFSIALGAALVFSILATVVGLAAGLFILATGIATMGLGWLILIPLLVIFGWMIPAAELMLFAHFFPQYLAVNGWLPAILGGLVIGLINGLTTSSSSSSKES